MVARDEIILLRTTTVKKTRAAQLYIYSLRCEPHLTLTFSQTTLVFIIVLSYQV